MNATRSNKLSAPSTRAGITLIYITVGLVALVGLCSLAADYGRVQLAKTELRQVADAAARAGIALLPDTTAVQNEVADIGAANSAAGSAVNIVAGEDIEFLTWNQTDGSSVVRTGSNRSRANAIRVTARLTSARGNAVHLPLAEAVGIATCDVSASGVTMITRTIGPTELGFIGLDSLEMNGSVTVDSYNSTVGPPSVSNRYHHGSLGTNGDVDVEGSVSVYGDIRAGIGRSLTLDPDAYVTGSTANLNEALAYDAPSAGSAATTNKNNTIAAGFVKNGGKDLEVGSNKTLTLTSGNYYFRNIDLKGGGELLTTGQVNLYVYGAVDLAGHTESTNPQPPQLKIYVTGTGPVDLGGTSSMTADLLAPMSDVRIHGNVDYRGRAVGRNLRIIGNPQLHFDETLLSGTSTGITSSPIVSLVD